MGIWSALDDITLFRYEQASYEAERYRKPSKDAPWYRQHVSEFFQVSWFGFLCATVGCGILLFAFVGYSKGATWWPMVERGMNMVWGPICIAMSGLVFVGAFRLNNTRRRARARRARVAPFVAARTRSEERWVATARHAIALRQQQPEDNGSVIAAVRSQVRPLLILGAVYMFVRGIEEMTDLPMEWLTRVLLLCVFAIVLWSVKSGRGRAMARQRAKRCPHCDYDLASATSDGVLAEMGVDAGPARCTECGLRYPLVPPATAGEVDFWDWRTRRGSA